MRKLFACMIKETLLLGRDKLALAILFIMPVFFLLIITLLQNTNSRDPARVSVLFYNQDQGNLSKTFYENLSHSSAFKLIDANALSNNQLSQAQAWVANGRYPILLVLPAQMTEIYTRYSQHAFVNKHDPLPAPIMLYLDPAFSPIALHLLNQGLTQNLMQYQLKIAGELVSNALGTVSPQPLPADNFIKTQYLRSNQSMAQPNPVQQNVPAWAIFGMFFIVIPIAGIVIKERELQIQQRLRIAPLNFSVYLSARLLVFASMNLLQLFFMFLVGIFIFPHLGLPALSLFNFPALLLTAVLTAFAASSFGLLIGSFSKTQEQASALGPLLVVMAAAIGGIMFPTYLMPETLQLWSAWSPLNWSQTAFIDILVRQASFITVLPALLKLLGFSVIALGLSAWRR